MRIFHSTGVAEVHLNSKPFVGGGWFVCQTSLLGGVFGTLVLLP